MVNNTGESLDLANSEQMLGRPAPDGTNVLSFNGGNNPVGSSVSQDFDTVIGENYAVRFNVAKNGGGSGEMAITVSITSNTGVLLKSVRSIAPASSQGRNDIFTFTATTSITKIELLDSSTGTVAIDLIIDDIVIALAPPLLATIRVSEVEVCWNSEINSTYQVQYRSALTTNAWTNLGSTIQGNGSTNCLTDPVDSQNQRYYRVFKVP